MLEILKAYTYLQTLMHIHMYLQTLMHMHICKHKCIFCYEEWVGIGSFVGAGTMNGIGTSGSMGKDPELEYPVRFGEKSMKSYSGANSGVGFRTALISTRCVAKDCAERVARILHA